MLITKVTKDEAERVKSNADIIEETYYEYHGEYIDGSDRNEYDGYHIVQETEVCAV